MINTEYNKNSNDVAMSLKLELVANNPKTESNSQATSARKPKGLEGAQTSFAKPKVEYTSSALINQTLSEYSKKTPQELKSALNKFGVTESNYHEFKPVIEHVIKHIEPQLVSFFGQDQGGAGDVQPSPFQNMIGNVNPFYLINEIMQKSGDNVSLSEISDMQSMNTAQSQFQNQIQGLQGEQTNIENEEAKQSSHHIWSKIIGVVVAVVGVALIATGVGAVAGAAVDAVAGSALLADIGLDAAADVVVDGAEDAVEKGMKDGAEDTVKETSKFSSDETKLGPDEGLKIDDSGNISGGGGESSFDKFKNGLKKLVRKIQSAAQEEVETLVDASEMGQDIPEGGVKKYDSEIHKKTYELRKVSGTNTKAFSLSMKGLKVAALGAVPVGAAVVIIGHSTRQSIQNNKITQYQNTASMISTNMQNIQQQSQFQNSNMNNAQQQLSAFASVENAMFKAAAQTSQIQMV